MVGRGETAVHLHHVVLGDAELLGDVEDHGGRQIALVELAEAALETAQVEEQLLLRGRRAHLHERAVVQHVFLDGGADPPHRVGREPEAAVRIELGERLDQATLPSAIRSANGRP